MSGVRAKAWARAWSMGLVALVLSGCEHRRGSEQAALAVAEAACPGQFEIHDSYLQKGHYDVALVKRDDPLTRVRFAIDADPAQCSPGAACEDRFRRAHAYAVSSATKIKALNTGFGQCGVPLLGFHEEPVAPTFRTIVELDLDSSDQQPALDRLGPCIDAFRRALPARVDSATQTLALRIIRPVRGSVTPPAPLSLDSRLPTGRADEPGYQVTISAGQDRALAADLRLSLHSVRASDLGLVLAEVAQRALANDPRGGHVPNRPLSWRLKLDSERLDVIHAYVLACSAPAPENRPCRTDIAVQIRYDLASEEASQVVVMRDVRGPRGIVNLPELPGR